MRFRGYGLVAVLVQMQLAASTSTWDGFINSGWNTPGNWSPSGVPNSSTVTAYFPNGSNTECAVNGTFSVATLEFDASAVSLSSGGGGDGLHLYTSITASNSAGPGISCALFLEDTITITLDLTSGLGLYGAITGSPGAGITLDAVAGGGIVQLLGASSYSGATTINGGTLSTNEYQNVLSDASAFVLANTAGVVLQLNGTNNEIGSLAGGGSTGGVVYLNGAILTIGNDNTSTTFSGAIEDEYDGGGGITKIGTGALTLAGANSYSGPTVVSGGTLALSGSGTIADGSSLTISSGATFSIAATATGASINNLSGAGHIVATGKLLTVDQSSPGTLSGAISGSGGSLMKAGSDVLYLTGSSSYTGVVTVEAGTLSVVNNSCLGGAVDLTGGILSAAATFSTAKLVTISGTSSGIDVENGAIFTINGAISDGASPGELNVTSGGDGILVLGTTNSYTGGTTISSGTLSIGEDGALGDMPNTLSGFLALNGGTLAVTSTFTLAGDRIVTTSSENSAINVSGGETFTIMQPISEDGYSYHVGLSLNGAGTLQLGGVCSYSKQTYINDGTLQLIGAGSIESSEAVYIGGTLDVTEITGTYIYLNTISGSGNILTNETINDTLAISQSDQDNQEYNGVISGAATLLYQGGERLYLYGINTYTGGTKITGGTLAINADSGLGLDTTPLMFQSEGSLEADTTLTLSSLRTVTVSGDYCGFGTSGDVTFTIMQGITDESEESPGGVYIFDNDDGDGTVVFSGINTYSLGTYINGTLSVAADSALGSTATGAGLISLDGGTLAATATFTLDFSRQVNTSSDDSGFFVEDGQTLTINQPIIDDYYYSRYYSGGIYMSSNGSGILQLGGECTYTGPTHVYSGTMELLAGGSIADAESTSINDGATLDCTQVAATLVTLQTLSGGGDLEGNGQALDVIQNSYGEFSGTLSGFNILYKDGSEELTLEGDNTYTGGSVIYNGKLSVYADSGLGDTAGQVTIAGGTLGALDTFTLASTRGAVLTSSTYSGIYVEENQTLTIYNAIDDGTSPGGITVTSDGDGIVIFGGVNSYSGGTTIDSGVLSISADNALGNTLSGFVALNGGTLQATATFSLLSSREVSTTSDNSTIDVSDGKIFTIPQPITDGYTFGGIILTSDGAGVLQLGAACTYTGPTVIESGTLVLLPEGSIADAVSIIVNGTLDLVDVSADTISINTLSGSGSIIGYGQLLQVIQNQDETFSGSVTGVSALSKQGSNQLTLTGANYYDVNTAIQDGTLSIAMDSSLGSTYGALLFEGGTLAVTGTFTLSAMRTTTTDSSTSTIDVADGETFTITQAINDGGSSGALTLTGDGTLVLSGTSGYSGGMTIDSGVLSIDEDRNLGGASGPLTLGGGTLLITTGFTLSNMRTVETSSDSSVISVNDGETLTIPQAIGDGTSSGGITLTSSGAGILELQGACSYTGPTIVDSGSLNLTHSGSLADSSSTTIADGATIDASGITATSLSLNDLSGAGDLVITEKTLTVTQSGYESFSGIISGGGGALTVSGGSTFALFGANSYDGGTHISSGTIALIDNGSIGDSSSITIDGSSVLDLTGTSLSSFSFNNLSGAGDIYTNPSENIPVTIDQTASGTFSGSITGACTLILTGDATLALTGGSFYTGGTQVQSGILSISSDAALGDTSGALSLEGGALAVTATFDLSTDRTVTTSDSSTTIDVATEEIFGIDQVIANGAFSGGLTVTSGGTGVLSLRAACSYTGPTVVSSGTLALSLYGAIDSSSSTTIDDGATLDATYVYEYITLNTLSGAGSILTDGQPLTINQTAPATFSGTISGSPIFSKEGAETLTLASANTLGGTATISEGTLALAGDGALGDAALLINTGAIFDVTAITATTASINTLSGDGVITTTGKSLSINQTSDEIFSGDITGDSSTSFTLSGSATLTLSGVLTYSGSTTISSGTLALSGSTSISESSSVAISGTLDVTAATTSGVTLSTLSGAGTLTGTGQDLIIDQGSFGIFSGSVSGNSITKTGSAVLALTGSTDLSGDVAVQEGTLALNTTIAHAISVASGATLKGTGTVGGNATIDGTISPGNSIGPISVTGVLTLNSGSTTNIEINPSSSSQIDVTGAAMLDGTLHITADPGIYIGETQYTVLIADGGLGDTTFSFVTGGAVGTELQVAYTSDSVLLTYLTHLRDYTITGNAARVIDHLNNNSDNPSLTPVFDVLGVLPAAQLTAAAIAITPARNATATFASQNSMFTFSKSVSTHLGDQRILRAMYQKGEPGEMSEEIGLLAVLGDGVIAPAGSVRKIAKGEERYALWSDGFVETSHQNAQNQIPSINILSGGFLFGFDAYLSDRGQVGCAVGYARDTVHETQNQGNNSANLYVASLYGTHYVGNAYVEGALWATYDQYQTKRNVAYPGFDHAATAQFNGAQVTPHIGLGYDHLFKNKYVVEPFAMADWVVNFQSHYEEHGAAPLNMTVQGSTSSMFRFETGLNCYQIWEQDWGMLVLRETVSYVYKRPYSTGKITAAIVGADGTFINDSFTARQKLASPSIEIFFRHKRSNWFCSALYDGEFGSGYRTNEALITIGRYF